jgi:hypothetical protein
MLAYISLQQSTWWLFNIPLISYFCHNIEATRFWTLLGAFSILRGKCLMSGECRSVNIRWGSLRGGECPRGNVRLPPCTMWSNERTDDGQDQQWCGQFVRRSWLRTSAVTECTTTFKDTAVPKWSGGRSRVTECESWLSNIAHLLWPVTGIAQ